MNANIYTIRKMLLALLLCCGLGLVPSGVSAQFAVDAAMVSPHNGKLYMFRGDSYIRIDPATMTMDPGYPNTISAGWGSTTFPAGWDRDWDAMAPIEDGTNNVYIFKGNECIIWDITGGTVYGPVTMTSLVSNWPSTAGRIKAALASYTSTRIYLYDESEWFLYDPATYTMTGSSGTINSLHGDYIPDNYEALDGAFYVSGTTTKRYYIRGTQITEWRGVGDYTNYELPALITNWGYTDAVNPYANGGCDLDMQITDDACGDLQKFPVIVTDPGFGANTLGGTCKLYGISVHIKHTYVSDLTLKLTSPNGVSVTLASSVGGSADDFGLSCADPTFFTTNATIPASASSAPFAGFYLPEGNFNDFLDGSSAVGNWLLEVCDGYGGDYGTVEHVELVFESYSPVAVDKSVNEIELTVYPNPSSGMFQVDLGRESADGTLMVSDMSGKLIWSGPATGRVTALNLSTQAAGMYLLSYRSEDGAKRLTQRLTITH